MKIFVRKFYLLFCVSVSLISSNGTFAQKPLYNIEFVNAVWTTSQPNNNHWSASQTDTNILAVFQLTPIDKKDFPPIVSEKITYSFDNEKETTMTIMNQKETKISLLICDRTVKDKDRQVYELVKDRIEHYNGEDIKFIAFYFFKPTAKKPHSMSITYGMWEKNNQDVRVEKRYDFAVQ